jgi:5-methyltetrahydropteroyltriglutamate--homocysteine methyltransferase
MQIPTEPIGSIPRPPELIHAVKEFQAGRRSQDSLEGLYRQALVDTLRRFEETGSPVITDGEQTKPSFATYPVHGGESLAPDGAQIPFADGHVRQLPRLVSGPFRYITKASTYLSAAQGLTQKPLKQAVISASALSLLYPQAGITATPGRPSSRTSSTRRRRISGVVSTKAPTTCRSTSRRAGSPSSSTRRAGCCASSSI